MANHIENCLDRRCTGCNACVAACPRDAISLKKNKEGFWYPQVDREKCVNCGLCIQGCPVYSGKEIRFLPPKSYAAWNKDDEVRKKSSSGGLFSSIADQVLRKGGVVYGAAYGEGCKVGHIRVDSPDRLWRLRSSKYVHSLITKDIYRRVAEDLKERRVFFTGTPCQTAGMITYCERMAPDHLDNLLTAEVLCHGVPSPKSWKEYLKEVAGDRKVVGANMRDKRNGWSKFYVSLTFEDGTEHAESFFDGVWGPSFFSNLFLRESCYECNFKRPTKMADLTLGDFWGAAREDELRKYDDADKGTSVVLVNSEKGEKLLKELENCYLEEIPYDCLKKGLYVLYRSSNRNFHRKWAFKQLGRKPFSEIVRHTRRNTVPVMVVRKLWMTKNNVVAKFKRK